MTTNKIKLKLPNRCEKEKRRRFCSTYMEKNFLLAWNEGFSVTLTQLLFQTWEEEGELFLKK